jgi:hypothetical protein
MYKPEKIGAPALLAVAIAVALSPLVVNAADEPKAETKVERKFSIKVNGKEQEDVAGAIEAAMAKLQSALASKEAALARANVNVNIDVNEIRETIRKSIEDANQYGTMITRRSSSDEVVKGNPYSAREVREFKQTLGDGTVISRQSTRLLARDREGRLRQELRQPDGTARVYINDPVAREVLILDPQKRIACRADFDKKAINDCFNQTRGDWKPLGFAFNIGKNGVGMMNANDDLVVEVSPHAQIIDLTREIKKRSGQSDGSMVPPVPPVPPVPALPSLSALKGMPGSEHAQVTREKKTKQPYEGLLVDTDRTVETIAAGVIGNNKPIESIHERYYSPEFNMNVYVRRSDPRNGESVYRMVDVKRTEPDGSVFRVPSGYTLSEGKK